MALELIQAIILAAIQGITEWLPLSSSAHLGLAQIFMKAQTPILFDILLHVGTLISAIIYFRKELIGMTFSLLKLNTKDPYFQLLWLLILASIPTAIIGFAFHDYFSSMFFSLFWIGVTLIINAIFMYFSEIEEGKQNVGKLSAFLMGIAQGISIAPGISRSGATIGTALLMKVDREKAARFSFLLSIPAIIGATVFEWKGSALGDISSEIIVISILVSAIVGYLSIDFMMKFVRKKGLRPFANYCLLLGALSLALSFMK